VPPGAVHEVKGQGPDHESACHLRRGKRQTAANGVAAKIQTETTKKLGPMSVQKLTSTLIQAESVHRSTTDIERRRRQALLAKNGPGYITLPNLRTQTARPDVSTAIKSNCLRLLGSV
jgi:hypothetical protein